ncbi:BMP family lipoprotein [Pasteuria penetrans]|uniref:BMP family lipoprotein n=1 Tax=Pasteuria penetrans TaxID=86005 RepID=UPI000F94E292|nr:BMP family ABC transporter substrate-binding protein [Pasteuria penetrans]
MNGQKKWMIGLCVVGFVPFALGLAGCGNPEGETNGVGRDFRAGLVLDIGGRNDDSFGQMAYQNMEGMRKKGELTYLLFESEKGSDYVEGVERVAREKPTLTFLMADRLSEATQRVAKRHPNLRFAIMDSDMGQNPPPNVAACSFRDQEGSFLAGLSAGMTTNTGKVAFVGGILSPVIRRFQAGFAAGAMLASQIRGGKPVEVRVTYANSFNDEDTGRSLARLLFSENVDVIYHAAGRVGKGVFRAARERGPCRCWVIGQDKDQHGEAPDHTLGSVLKKTDVVTRDIIRRVKEGDFSSFGKVGSYGIREGSIDFKEDYASNLGTGKMKQLEKVVRLAKEEVARGLLIPDTPEEVKSWKVGADFLGVLRRAYESP